MAFIIQDVQLSAAQITLAGSFILIGLLYSAVLLKNLVSLILSNFIIPGQKLSSFGSRGSWAVVTGASDGIGKQYALQLAKAGFNIVLVSRTASKLEALSAEITAANGNSRTEILAMDFSRDSESDYSRFATILKGKDVAILVNNVGQSHDIPVVFGETPEQEMQSIITINCLGTLKVTRLVLPAMQARRRGLILTMGSFGGLLPTPLLATYSGSKAFLQNWSNALAAEVKESGITVHFIQAYLVTSAMSKIRRSNFMYPTEKQFVQSSLAKIGNQGGSIGYAYSGTPWWSHAMFAWVLLTIGHPFGSFLLGQNLKNHKEIRARALKKAERLRLEAKKGK